MDGPARATLATAFAATTYRVELDGHRVAFRIGERCPDLDSRTGGGWAWLTAVNPGARRLPAEANARRLRELAGRLASLGCPHWPAESSADAGDWPIEPGFVVAGLNLDAARALAGEFGQAAMVWGDGVNPARLEWLSTP
jgi:hypothetical protein